MEEEALSFRMPPLPPNSEADRELGVQSDSRAPGSLWQSMLSSPRLQLCPGRACTGETNALFLGGKTRLQQMP